MILDGGGAFGRIGRRQARLWSIVDRYYRVVGTNPRAVSWAAGGLAELVFAVLLELLGW